ncbi:hypothetical protein QCA50_008658 [Cerrena zonata]|uniref:BTB domain-containing protein n=1 Tax=Cerrena zonata TaxID=2478898 RepID=A0AAW0G4P1_9APHY
MDANDTTPSENVAVAQPTAQDPDRKPTRAQAPFDDEDGDADLILRSSDKVDFYVHKLILKKASALFQGMFQDASSEQSVHADASHQTSSLPVVDNIDESSSTLDSILRICYPVDEVKQTSLDKVAEVLRVALKLQMQKATTNMKKELLTYVPTDPLSVYAKACILNLEYEASQAAEEWRKQYNRQKQNHCNPCRSVFQMGPCGGCCSCFSFPKSVGGLTYREVMQQNTAGQFHRLIQFAESGTRTEFCFSPSRSTSSSDGGTPDSYAFTNFPNPDITIQSVDGVNFPTHTSVLIYASASEILKKKENSSIIQLDEDGRTLATLLQLCYPYADFEVTSGTCSISLIARVREAAEKYRMPAVVRAAEYLMSEQVYDHPLDVFFAASRHGWLQDAERAAALCSALTRDKIEGPGSYTKEMENVSAEVYYTLLKRWYDTNAAPGTPPVTVTNPSVGWNKKKKGRR